MAARTSAAGLTPNVLGTVTALAPLAAGGGVVLVYRGPLGDLDQTVCQIGGDGDVIDLTDLPGDTAQITGVTSTRAGIVLGTREGLLTASGDSFAPFDSFLLRNIYGTIYYNLANKFRPHVREVVADGDGNVWFFTHGPSPVVYTFATDPDKQRGTLAGSPPERAVVRLDALRASLWAISGHTTGGGVYAYGYLGEQVGSRWHSPNLALLAPSLPLAHTGTPPGEVLVNQGDVPILLDARLAANPQGGVWLAGDALGGPKVYAVSAQTVREVSPPSGLIQNRRLVQLAAFGPRLYAATDGVGVLAFDGADWYSHPINEHIPAVEGTQLKIVEHIAIDTDGDLWAVCGTNLIVWREDQ